MNKSEKLLKEFKNLHIIDHPIILETLSKCRNKETNLGDFRKYIKDISRLLAFESMRSLVIENKKIETPHITMDAPFICDVVSFVAIMRSGNAMLDGFTEIFPGSDIGHIGIYHDKFVNTTVEYYFKLSRDIGKHKVYLLDPLLATGATVIASIDRLK
ncbi:MAG: uracil phosphoribosyltransferase, partial [Silvanigrellaceae bacterium]|nr:uracil phosphoribosyltransferase [Silvanigrellaceae bacterium]